MDQKVRIIYFKDRPIYEISVKNEYSALFEPKNVGINDELNETTNCLENDIFGPNPDFEEPFLDKFIDDDVIKDSFNENHRIFDAKNDENVCDENSEGEILNYSRLSSGFLTKIKDEVKHKCALCGYITNKFSNFKRHQRSCAKKTAAHTCKICKKVFRKARVLHRHSKEVHGDKEFHCSICRTSFSRRDRLTEHQMKQHDVKS